MAIQFYIEDLKVDVPTVDSFDASPTQKEFVKGGYTVVTKGSTKFEFQLLNGSILTRLEEMCSNPFYSAVKIQDIEERINSGMIKNFRRDWRYGASKIQLGIIKGSGSFLLYKEDAPADCHPDFVNLVFESFETAQGFPNNTTFSTSVNSNGYGGEQGRQQTWTYNGAWRTDSAEAVEGSQSVRLNSAGGNVTMLMVGQVDWGDYDISVNFKVSSASAVGGIAVRQAGTACDYVRIGYNNGTLIVSEYDYNTDSFSTVFSQNIGLTTDQWYVLKARCEGDRIVVSVDDDVICDVLTRFEYRLPSNTRGAVGLWATTTTIFFDDFRCFEVYPAIHQFVTNVNYISRYVADHITGGIDGGTDKIIESFDQISEFVFGGSGSHPMASVRVYDDSLRVYSEIHEFTGDCYIYNNLFRMRVYTSGNYERVSFQYYNSSSWVEVGEFNPFFDLVTDYYAYANFEGSHYYLEAVAPDFASIIVSYYGGFSWDKTKGMPEYFKVQYRLTIRSGVAGAEIEQIGNSEEDVPQIGFAITLTQANVDEAYHTTGTVLSSGGTTTLNTANMKGNYVVFKEISNWALGVCWDGMNAATEAVTLGVSGSYWNNVRAHGAGFGGVFVVNMSGVGNADDKKFLAANTKRRLFNQVRTFRGLKYR